MSRRLFTHTGPPEHQRAMFGCTTHFLDVMIKESIMAPDMLAASILSDAQECLALRDNERCRQLINRAKYVIFECLTVKEGIRAKP